MNKVRWNTEKVMDAVQAALPDAEVENTGFGGDFDTDNLQVKLPCGETIHLCGFITNGYFDKETEKPHDVDIELVELTCGHDSRGGTFGVRNPEAIVAYGKLNAALVGLGFTVVPCMEDYF